MKQERRQERSEYAMKITLERTIEESAEFNLFELSFNEWPKEAKSIAYSLLAGKSFKARFDRELPQLRLSLLVAEVERIQDAINKFEWDM